MVPVPVQPDTVAEVGAEVNELPRLVIWMLGTEPPAMLMVPVAPVPPPLKLPRVHCPVPVGLPPLEYVALATAVETQLQCIVRTLFAVEKAFVCSDGSVACKGLKTVIGTVEESRFVNITSWPVLLAFCPAEVIM